MNHRLQLLLAVGFVGLAHAPFAGADMTAVQRDQLGMNYAGGAASATGSAAGAAAIIPMDTAVKAAENQTPGRAISAELTGTRAGPAYLVEFADNGANRDVWVDARSGKVERTETLRAASAPGD